MFSQVLLLFFINVMSAIGYSLLAPLYPSVAKSKGVEDYMIGIIFSIFAVSNIISIPLTPKLIVKLGRRKLFYLAMLIEAACTMLFGMVSEINNPPLFIFVSLVARFCQGIGSALSSTLVYSIAATVCDQDNLEVTMGYMELAYSIGLTIGPLVGSSLYYLKGYDFPFYVCGLLTLVCIPFIKNLTINEEMNDNSNFLNILFDKDILPTSIAIIIDMITTTFIYPVFSEHLNNKFGLSIEMSSIFFVISMVSYFITIQYLNKISTRLGVKLTITIGLFINFLAVPFLAPVSFLPQNLITIVFGLVVLGITGACITIPGIVDFMDTMKNKLGMDEMAANDVSSAIYNLSINIGEALGPVVGGTYTHFYSFNAACNFTSLLCLISSVCYSLYNINTIRKQSYSSQPIDRELNEPFIKIIAQKEKRNKSKSIDKYSYVTRQRAYSMSSSGYYSN